MKRNVLLWLAVMVTMAVSLGGCATDISTAGPRMHPSWDRNNDGINDCEDDGTCDDSIDYTKPRPD